MADDQAPERYFYHSFPRRGRDTGAAIDKGCRTLEMIRDYGLLMAPEVVRWDYSHADGTAPRSADTLQRRACFTELSPHELAGHAGLFGSFALEFDIPIVKSFGAIPVFYIPRALTEPKGAEGAASTLVMQLIDAMVLVERIAAIQERQRETSQAEGDFSCKFGLSASGPKEFVLDVAATAKALAAVTHALTPAPDLHQALQVMTNFFYPADDFQGSSALRYYHEREWRLGGAMAIRGEDLMGQIGPGIVKLLMEIDAEFFGREMPPGSGKTMAESSFIFPGLGATPVIQSARRVIAPAAAVGRVRDILKDVPTKPNVVAIEALADAKR